MLATKCPFQVLDATPTVPLIAQYSTAEPPSACVTLCFRSVSI